MPKPANPLLVVASIPAPTPEPAPTPQPVIEFPATVTQQLLDMMERLDGTLRSLSRETPFEEVLWDIHDVSAHFKKTAITAKRYIFLPSFPVAIQLPATSDPTKSGNRLWLAVEVIAWGKTYRAGGPRVGRPRQR